MATPVEDVTTAIDSVKANIVELKASGADKATVKPHIVSGRQNISRNRTQHREFATCARRIWTEVDHTTGSTRRLPKVLCKKLVLRQLYCVKRSVFDSRYRRSYHSS